jgi:hypothetical protein
MNLGFSLRLSTSCDSTSGQRTLTIDVRPGLSGLIDCLPAIFYLKGTTFHEET